MPIGYFGIKLAFYNKDANAKKIMVVNFDCKETVAGDQEDDGGFEEQKFGQG